MYQRHHRNWYDYNVYSSKEGEYLNYFNTSVIPNRSRVKNPSIIPNESIPKKSKKFNIPNAPNSFQFPNAPNAPNAQNNIPKNKDMPKIPDALHISKGKYFKPTNTSIPDDILMKARFAQASKIYYEEGESAAQDYLDSFDINYTIEHTLSTGIGLVLINNDTGEVTIAYRGTDINNPTDLLTDALAFGGAETLSPEYGNVKEQLEAVTEMYGKPAELVGFSRGSVLSMNLSNEYDIPSTELNPLISPSLLLTQETGSDH